MHARNRLRRNTLWGLLVTAVVLISVTSCSAEAPSDSVSADSSSTPDASAVAIDTVLPGGIAAGERRPPELGQYGSRTRPLEWWQVAAQSSAGSSVILRQTSDNTCLRMGWYTRSVHNAHGITTRYGDFYVTKPDGTVEMVLMVCSVETTPAVSSWTIGPGADGMSAACPPWAPRIVHGTGQVSDYFGEQNSSIQVSGSYGRNNDGLWNFKYLNMTNEKMVLMVYALCE